MTENLPNLCTFFIPSVGGSGITCQLLIEDLSHVTGAGFGDIYYRPVWHQTVSELPSPLATVSKRR